MDTSAAQGREVRLLSPSAMHSSLEALAEAHRKQGGDVIRLKFETAPTMLKLFAAGEAPDIVVAPPATMDEIVKMGKAVTDGRFILGRVGAGVVVRAGAPMPDVSTVEALKRAVLEADAVVYNRASSGLYVARMLENLGLAEQIKGKTKVFYDAVETFSHILAAREKEIGFGGLTEIARWRDRGLRLVGPLPAEVQNYTAYAVALAPKPANPEGARAFFRFLGSSAARAIMTDFGVDK
jgi:molybdate transport system substrate-binding protein